MGKSASSLFSLADAFSLSSLVGAFNLSSLAGTSSLFNLILQVFLDRKWGFINIFLKLVSLLRSCIQHILFSTANKQ